MASRKSEFKYFIIAESQHSRPGSLCYILRSKYETEFSRKKKPASLCMSFMGSYKDHDVVVDFMSCLSTTEAELLCALENNTDRHRWFQEQTVLKAAVGLTVDTPVTVEVNGEDLQGIIRSIKPLPEKKCYDPISGTIFGIELQGKDKGKGQLDADMSWSKPSYHYDQSDGLLVVPFSSIRPVAPIQSKQITKGDMVSYVGDQNQCNGLVLGLGDYEGEPMVHIATDTGELTVPLNCVAKKEDEEKEPPGVPEACAAPGESPAGPAAHLGVNSLVELTLSDGCAYGMIRWIGSLPGREDTMCGLELDEPRGVCDGSFKEKYLFSCAPKKGLFVKLATCRPDSRFPGHSAANPSAKVTDEDATGYEGPCDPIDPVSTDQVDRILIGRMKGIQGHCNSCYMDAALFSLFSCSSVLDSLLFKQMKPKDIPIQNTLLQNIVNPLRSRGYVEGKHVMRLRQQLLSHGYSHTFTTDEKDPEEFLTIIMQHIMALEPLLKLSAGGKVQESYCYQIFLDQNHSLVLPTVQQLLEHSFHSAGLKLAESPSCLILQMPRFGKKFKMFDKIIPSLELDVTDLLTEGPQQCLLCGQLASIECTECFKDSVFSQTGFKLFCKPCSTQVHSHPHRQGHRCSPLQLPRDFSEAAAAPIVRDKLELFAVLCIETSHYVSFVKHGPESRDWIFFDSMADRQGGVDGYNIPQIQACPEVGEYLDMPPAELANQVPREMRGVAKRLFCDAYMYLYRNSAHALYR